MHKEVLWDECDAVEVFFGLIFIIRAYWSVCFDFYSS